MQIWLQSLARKRCRTRKGRRTRRKPPRAAAGADGLSPETAASSWRALNIQPGDSILFARGSFFRDVLELPEGAADAPLYIGAYGEGDKPVFCGGSQILKPFFTGKLYDYTDDELFTLRNAELTAEGAVELILREYEGAVCGTCILVTGYGRIGKVLSRYLNMMGADVTVAARKASDRDQITGSGMIAADYHELDFSRYQVIVNTVPAEVIDKEAIAKMREDVFIIDLASIPGGVDFSAAKARELSCIHALSLPGKTAPLTAGIIIKDTIMNLLDREGILG